MPSEPRSPAGSASSLARAVRRLAADRHGLALVETALTLPVLLTLWIGTFETTRAFQADRRITMATVTIADLASRDDVFTSADLDEVHAAGRLLLDPMPSTSLTLRVTRAEIDADGRVVVTWSLGKGAAPIATGTILDIDGYEQDTTLTIVDTSFEIAPVVPMPPFTDLFRFAKRQVAATRPFPEITEEEKSTKDEKAKKEKKEKKPK